MIYYTSDLHLGHKNIIKYENRPFKDIFEMTDKLIENWNSVVRPEDTVYHLGDFAFKNSYMNIDRILDTLNRLNGDIHLIIGNHDMPWIEKDAILNALPHLPKYYEEIEDNGKIVVLSHYPIEDWDGKYHGAYHVHGHIHSQDIVMHLPNRFNCGVDVRDYKPCTLEELVQTKQTIPSHRQGFKSWMELGEE